MGITPSGISRRAQSPAYRVGRNPHCANRGGICVFGLFVIETKFMHRFFVSPESIIANEVTLTGAVAHQIYRVLRMSEGMRVIVLDDSGYEWEIELTDVTKHTARGQIIEKRLNANEPAIKITLYQALIRAKNFEMVLQRATEVGVTAFVPLVCERNVVDARGVDEGKLTRWRRIIQEAAEQSRRGRLPRLSVPRSFAAAVALAKEGNALIASVDRAAPDLKSAIATLPRSDNISLFVGPEGGFTSVEITLARQNGIVAVNLGKRVWRSETAGIVFPAMVLHELE